MFKIRQYAWIKTLIIINSEINNVTNVGFMAGLPVARLLMRNKKHISKNSINNISYITMLLSNTKQKSAHTVKSYEFNINTQKKIQ